MIFFSALGHMIRDGFPALGSTLAARLAGATVVFVGLLIVTDWMMAAASALAVLAGFYTDVQHGEANKGDWTAGIVSGCTSLAPVAVTAAALAFNVWWLLIVVLGVTKPLIWQAAWRLDPGRFAKRVPPWAVPITEPTRVAAIMWGAQVGVLVTTIGVSAP